MFTFHIFEMYFSLILLERTTVMEGKQIEARIGDWPRVVISTASKDALSRFLPRFFTKNFSKAVFINIL